MNDQPLSKNILQLISAVTVQLPEQVRQIIVDQIHEATVLNEVPGRVINFAIPQNVVKTSLPDGPMYPIPAVIGSGGEVEGELILWIKDGYAVGLEHPWFTDEPPETWPDVARISFS
ncbi:hypothetical protein ACTJJ4_17870 [Microbacterium sp. 22195]|uniref:hypothetical protein n=1 Tax=Microbacterium sp. 22195 TaxID=3453891 RepID=UPI003F872B52